MTAHRQLKQNYNEGYNSSASLARLILSFIECFILLVIAPLPHDDDGRRCRRRCRVILLIRSICWSLVLALAGCAPVTPPVGVNCCSLVVDGRRELVVN